MLGKLIYRGLPMSLLFGLCVFVQYFAIRAFV